MDENILEREVACSASCMTDFSRRGLMQLAAGMAILPAVSLHARTVSTDFYQRIIKPDAIDRPKLRWWWPSANLDVALLASQLRSMVEAGFGSAEIATMSGGGWGSPIWRSHVTQACKVAGKLGLRIDNTLGPRWPAAVPGLDPDGTEAARVLVQGHVFLRRGEVYSGPIPIPAAPAKGRAEPGSQGPPPPPDFAEGRSLDLVGVMAARLDESVARSNGSIMLVPGSVLDVTRLAQAGHIEFAPPEAGQWVIVGCWSRGSGKTADGTSPIIDHFGLKGALALTKFWDGMLQDEQFRRSLRRAGGDWFEDSIELTQETQWTADLPEQFQARRGYALAEHLPVILLHFSSIFQIEPVFDYPDGTGTKIRNDYFETLTQLYIERHQRPLKAWANAQGLRYRQQPAYGATINMAATAVEPDIPETESLWFAEKIDAYRSMAGAVHMAERKIFSVETDCVVPPGVGDDAYAVTLPALLNLIHGHFVGGINQIVLHGMPYSQAENTAWPGYAPFQSVAGGLGEAWGPQSPQWTQMRAFCDYLARLQSALRHGDPRIDIAILRQAYWERGRDNWDLSGGQIWNDPGLVAHGYSYDYIDPSHLLRPNAVFGQGRLARRGAAYRALVIANITELGASPAVPPLSGHMTLVTARKLAELAGQGLPLIFLGPVPTSSPYHGERADDVAICRILEGVLALPHVLKVDEEADVPQALKQLGVRPFVSFERPCPDVFVTSRSSADRDIHFLYNQGQESTETGYQSQNIDLDVKLEGKGRPFLVSGWSGTWAPLALRNDGQPIRLRLPPHAALLIVVERTDVPSTMPIAVQHASGIKRPLVDWTLTVEDWRPGGSAGQIDIHRLDLGKVALGSWLDRPNLADVAGIGRYSTMIDLTASEARVASAILRLGPIEGSADVLVNGRQAAVNLVTFEANCTGLLQSGRNRIDVTIATTLNNRLRVMPGGGSRKRQHTGLQGPTILYLAEERGDA